MKPPDDLEIRVSATRLSPAGDGVTTLEGRELWVMGLLPGEEADVKIVHRGQGRLIGQIVRRHVVDPERRDAPCRHHGRCSGCPLMGVSLARQLALKRSLLADLGLEVSEVVSAAENELGYRWSAKRVAGKRAGALVLGSYRRGTHDIADMTGCLVDHPDLVAASDEIARLGSEIGVVPYDEASQTGDLRYVWLRTDGRGQVLVTLVTGASGGAAVDALARSLKRPTAVAVAVQAGAGNTLRGTGVRMIRGEPLQIDLGGASVRVGPLGFLQPNPVVAALAYAALVGDGRGALAFDLYAGAGLTTRMLRERFAEVIPCESFPESAAALGVAPSSAEAFLEGALSSGLAPDLVVANPPRAGLLAPVCHLLARLAPPSLRIMSCDPRSLARDLAILEKGGFGRREIYAFDTLPQTTHVELVAVLEFEKR